MNPPRQSQTHIIATLWAGLVGFCVFCAVIFGSFLIVEFISVPLSYTEWGRHHDEVLAWLPLSYSVIWVPISAIVGAFAATKAARKAFRRYTQVTSEIFDQSA
jgi:hypothetical protein